MKIKWKTKIVRNILGSVNKSIYSFYHLSKKQHSESHALKESWWNHVPFLLTELISIQCFYELKIYVDYY